ncbi:MAG: hypothetical protein GX372_04915 [Ignavibacteria bacterium]|jgi:GNAT superfamily N-acetyltransferase|nr:hypothetical protein [Ignavibacteria bacterium]
MDHVIKEVKTKEDLLKFIKSQWLFYKNNPNFVPPLIAERKELFDREKNPLYKHADYQLFLAEDSSGTVLGRIGAIENRRHNLIHDDSVGFFGFFECIDNQKVANSLFDAAARWLLSKGLTIMRGPTNPTFNDEIGMLIDGFDMPPVILMTYNPEYYLKLCDNYGFHKAKDLYAYLVEYDHFHSDKLLRSIDIIRNRYKASIRSVNFKNKKQLEMDVEIIRDIYNTAWELNWGFVKMTNEEFDHLVKQLKQVGIPETTLIAEIHGEPAGFVLGIPDINQVLIHNKNGGMLGAGLQLLTKKKKIDLLRLIVLGVKPEYRKLGLDSLLYYQIGENAKSIGIKKGEASWILEDNDMMNRALTQVMHANRYKTYRIYEKQI